MVDWRGSSLQIVIALIGSSLILTALTSLTSYFSKPSLDIYVGVEGWPRESTWYLDDAGVNHTLPDVNSTTYRIYLINNGYSTAKDVRLTMTYPNAVVVNATKVFENENQSIKQKKQTLEVAGLVSYVLV